MHLLVHAKSVGPAIICSMDTVIDPVSPPQSSLMPMPKAYASLNVLEALMETTKLMLV